MQCLKFGGSSLATAERFQNAAQIVALKPVNRICVCSAPGKHRPDEQKITDLLIRFAQTKEKEDGKRAAGEILARCRQIEKELCIPEAKLPSDKLAKELIEAPLAQTPEEQKLREDFLLPLGEIFSAHIMLYCLQQKGLKTRFVDPARAGLLLSDDKDGRIVNPACRERLCTSLSVALQEADVLVIPGFYGADKEGRRRVMPRGGSDLTAAWAAASLHIACDIYSDVSGVYEADPAAIPAARPIPSLSYAEMQAMAEYGAKVLHKDAVGVGFVAVLGEDGLQPARSRPACAVVGVDGGCKGAAETQCRVAVFAAVIQAYGQVVFKTADVVVAVECEVG